MNPTLATSPSPHLLSPIDLRGLPLRNRVVMAPLTRARAGKERVPNDLMVRYYTQRASAGLILAEATTISEQGFGWVDSPGIYNDAQVAGWAKVPAALHERGTPVFLQLWPCGRPSPPSLHGPPPPVPAPAPRHVTEGCLAVRNKASGFYANHHLMGGDWSYNSAYRNSNDFNFLMRPPDNSVEIDGVGHRIIGNLSYRGLRDVTRLNAAQCELKDNAFASEKKFTDAAFESLDEAALIGPREADGSLPKVAFLKPKDAKLASEAGYTAYAGKKAPTK